MLGIVAPVACDRIPLDLAVNRVVNGLAAGTLRVEFHEDGAGIRLERGFAERY